MALHFSRYGWMVVKCGWCVSWLWCLLMVFSLLVRCPRARASRRDFGQKWSEVVGLQFNNPLIFWFCSQLFLVHLVNYIGGEEDFGRPRGGVECWAGHLVFGLGAHQCGAFARSSPRLVTAARTRQSPDIYSGNLPRAPWLLHFMCNPQPPLLVLAYQVSQSFYLFEHLLFCSTLSSNNHKKIPTPPQIKASKLPVTIL